jgi:hypothetical protein
MEDLVREERLAHRQHLGSTWFFGEVRVAHLSSFLCFVVLFISMQFAYG